MDLEAIWSHIIRNVVVDVVCQSSFSGAKEGNGTVCPGSSYPAEKIINIFASENEVYTSYELLRYIWDVYYSLTK